MQNQWDWKRKNLLYYTTCWKIMLWECTNWNMKELRASEHNQMEKTWNSDRYLLLHLCLFISSKMALYKICFETWKTKYANRQFISKWINALIYKGLTWLTQASISLCRIRHKNSVQLDFENRSRQWLSHDYKWYWPHYFKSFEYPCAVTERRIMQMPAAWLNV